MQAQQKERSSTGEAKQWIKPLIKKLDAGSAELNVSGANDGPNQVS